MQQNPAEYIPQRSPPLNKFELRDYIAQLSERCRSNTPAFNPQDLAPLADEAVGHVRRIMRPYVEGKRSAELQQYYAPDVQKIESAHRSGDMRELGEALYWLGHSISVE